MELLQVEELCKIYSKIIFDEGNSVQWEADSNEI